MLSHFIVHSVQFLFCFLCVFLQILEFGPELLGLCNGISYLTISAWFPGMLGDGSSMWSSPSQLALLDLICLRIECALPMTRRSNLMINIVLTVILPSFIVSFHGITSLKIKLHLIHLIHGRSIWGRSALNLPAEGMLQWQSLTWRNHCRRVSIWHVAEVVWSYCIETLRHISKTGCAVKALWRISKASKLELMDWDSLSDLRISGQMMGSRVSILNTWVAYLVAPRRKSGWALKVRELLVDLMPVFIDTRPASLLTFWFAPATTRTTAHWTSCLVLGRAHSRCALSRTLIILPRNPGATLLNASLPWPLQRFLRPFGFNRNIQRAATSPRS